MSTKKNLLNAWDRIMAAITFAEANEPEIAREMLDLDRQEQRPDNRARKADQRPELRA